MPCHHQCIVCVVLATSSVLWIFRFYRLPNLSYYLSRILFDRDDILLT